MRTGDSPPKFEVGDGGPTAHVFVPPIFREVLFHISRSSVIACETKYEVNRKIGHEEFRVLKI